MPTNNPVGGAGLATDGVDPGFDPSTQTDMLSFLTDTVNSVATYPEDNYKAWTASTGTNYGDSVVNYQWVDNDDLNCGPEDLHVCPAITDPSNPECSGGSVAYYCALDDTIYIDVDFAYNADLEFGDFAVAYVVAHEYGHNVQTELGYPLGQTADWPQELQADCFAGAWGYAVITPDNLTRADVDGATNLISYLGDDAITGPLSRQGRRTPMAPRRSGKGHLLSVSTTVHRPCVAAGLSDSCLTSC